MLTRRQLLAQLGAAGIAPLLKAQDAAAKSYPPIRQITKGPSFHWFGYYDKLQFSPDNRFVLSNQTTFEGRSPTADDKIKVGMIDLQDGDKWIELGETHAWCWQQGCMLQWIPGTESKVIWNDRENDRFVSHIMDVKTREKHTLPTPIYALSPNGKEAVSCDFARVADCRPGYGYAGIKDLFSEDMAPEGSGVAHVDLETGKSRLIVSHKLLANTGTVMENHPTSKHHAYHLLVSPDGKRFIMLHRWTQPKGGHLTRLITANMDGSDLRIVIPNGYASHFIWRDATHILSQGKDWLGNKEWGDFLFEDKDSGIVEEIGHGVLDGSGHLTYLRRNEWILNDTYPKGVRRIQTPHLYEIAKGRRIDLGEFHSPREYVGEWRVDCHPRLSRDERWVCIDSPHNQGRQLYLIDIGGVV